MTAAPARGSITREYTCWCGICGAWEQTAHASTKHDAARLFVRHGWVNTAARGWVCVVCRPPRPAAAPSQS